MVIDCKDAKKAVGRKAIGKAKHLVISIHQDIASGVCRRLSRRSSSPGLAFCPFRNIAVVDEPLAPDFFRAKRSRMYQLVNSPY